MFFFKRNCSQNYLVSQVVFQGRYLGHKWALLAKRAGQIQFIKDSLSYFEKSDGFSNDGDATSYKHVFFNCITFLDGAIAFLECTCLYNSKQSGPFFFYMKRV